MRNRAAMLVFLMLACLGRCATQMHITPASTVPKTYLTPYEVSDLERKYYEAQLKPRKEMYTFSDIKSILADIIYQTGEQEKITIFVENTWASKTAHIVNVIGSFFRELGHKLGGKSETKLIDELKAMSYQGYAIQLLRQLYPDFYDRCYYVFLQSIETPAHFPALLLYYKVYKRFDDAESVWVFVKSADEEKIKIVLEVPAKNESVFPFFLHTPFYNDQRMYGLVDLDGEMLFDIFNNNIRLNEDIKWFNESLRYYAVRTAGALYDTSPEQAFEVLECIKTRRLYFRYREGDFAKYIWEKDCEKQFPPDDTQQAGNLRQCKLHRMLMSTGIDYFTMFFVDSPELTALTCFEEALKIQDSPEARALRDFMKRRLAKQSSQKKGLKSYYENQEDLDSLMLNRLAVRAEHWYRLKKRPKNRQRAFFWLELETEYLKKVGPYRDLGKLKKEYDEFVPTMKKYEEPVAYENGEMIYAMLYPKEQTDKKAKLERVISIAYLERGDLHNALIWRKKINSHYNTFDEMSIDFLEAKLGIKKPDST